MLSDLFPKRLIECRNNKGVTQKEVSKLIGISERGYQRYEAGVTDPTLTVAIALADYFGVSLDYLAGGLTSPCLDIFYKNPKISKKQQEWIEDRFKDAKRAGFIIPRASGNWTIFEFLGELLGQNQARISGYYTAIDLVDEMKQSIRTPTYTKSLYRFMQHTKEVEPLILPTLPNLFIYAFCFQEPDGAYADANIDSL